MPDYNTEDLRLRQVLSLRNYRNLEEYGIEFLTGEACAMGQRKLFDLTEEGIEHVERFFGGSVEIQRGTNTNPRGEASILLTGSTVKELALNIIWNGRPEADWLVVADSAIYVSSDETRSLYNDLFSAERNDKLGELMESLQDHSMKLYGFASTLDRYRREKETRWHRGQGLTSHPRRGDKNVHTFSGQTHPA